MPPFGPGFRRMFRPGRLTLGVMFPIEAFERDRPTMLGQEKLARRVEELGFAALWLRDVPLRDPEFGDIGQIYDPWVWLGYVTALTGRIALGTGSIILPLRHPLHVAKAAASVDHLSRGRLVLGIGAGDRPIEFPAFGVQHKMRGHRFRESLSFFRRALEESFPAIESELGRMHGADLIPKPLHGRIPVFVTGHSQQAPDWIAEHSDGWLMYAQHPAMQRVIVEDWRALTARAAPGLFKPFAQGLHVSLDRDPEAPPSAIHNGYHLGRKRLIELFQALHHVGVNHVFMNFKYGTRPAAEVVEEIAAEVLPLFPTPMDCDLPPAVAWR